MYRISAFFLLLYICIPAQTNQENNQFFMGQSFEQSGNFTKAKEVYEELYRKYKNNFQYMDALNRVYLQLKDYESSVSLIKDRLAVMPNDVNLLGMLGKTYHIAGDEANAFASWDKAAEQAAGNPYIYRVVSNFAIERRAFRKAVEILEKGKLAAPEDETFSFDLANIYSLLMQYENAANEYCAVLLRKPAQYNLVEARIMQYINKPEALLETIKAVEDHKKNSSINNLLGRLYIIAKEYEKAYSVYLDLEDEGDKQGVELFKFAQFAYAEGEFMYASKGYNEIIKQYPESPYLPSAKLGYAKTLEAGLIQSSEIADQWKPVSSGKTSNPEKFDEVISAYSDLIKLYAPTDVGLESFYRMGIIKFHYQNKAKEAEDYFYKVISGSPYSNFAIDSQVEIGDIQLIEGKLEDAFTSFSKIITNARAPEDRKRYAEFRTALIHFYKGDFESSKRILTGLAQNLKDNTANDAIELSLLLNTTMSDSSNLVLFSKAELLKAQRNFESAAAGYRDVYSKQGAFMLHHLSKIREAEMELALDNVENAVILLEKIAGEKEKNIYADKALYLLGKIHQHAKEDVGKAVSIYEELLAKFPNSLFIDEAREEILKIRSKSS